MTLTVFRHKDASSVNFQLPIQTVLDESVHDDDAKLDSAPVKVCQSTLISYLVNELFSGIDEDLPDSGIEIPRFHNTKILSPPSPSIASLKADLFLDANWLFETLPPTKLQIGDLIFTEKDRAHYVGVFTLHHNLPMVLFTSKKLESPVLLSLKAFLSEYNNPPKIEKK